MALSESNRKGDEEDEAPTGIRDPTPCEVCKYLAVELQGRLDETGKVRGYIETGHGLDPKKKKKTDYKKSELRLIEALNEPHVCDKILEYNVHAERKKSLRYAKGQSETMRTLHGLVDKGVKVELGIPYELWDQPSAEITHMQRQCFTLAEEHEEDIEDWYWGDQKTRLVDYLCRDRILKGRDKKCLEEEYVPKGDSEESDEESPKEAKKRTKKKSKSKGDSGTTTTTAAPPPVTPIAPPATDSSNKDEL